MSYRGRDKATAELAQQRDLSSKPWFLSLPGWDAMALFGCAPRRPLDYSGSAGLLWAINGGRLVELHRDWAAIDVPLHTRQRIFYRLNVEARQNQFALGQEDAGNRTPWGTRVS